MTAVSATLNILSNFIDILSLLFFKLIFQIISQNFDLIPAECRLKASESNRDQWRIELATRLGVAANSWIERHRQLEPA